MGYNKAFFGLYETVFLVLKGEFGENRAVGLFAKLMQLSLKKAYSKTGFKKGSSKDFVRVVGARDRNIGLRVSFPKVTGSKIIYRFHTDPFPGLKGKVGAQKLDGTYLSFKVNFLLGKNWSYKTTKHIWKGDKFTEHLIQKEL